MEQGRDNFIGQSALIAFKSRISSRPNETLLATNWSTAPNSICNWIGVSCSRRRQRVTALDLSHMGLQGTISPHIGNLSFLVKLDLSFNNFYGFIPHEISRLHRLRLLLLGSNQLEGSIPPTIQSCRKLHVVSFDTNHLIGAIPSSLGNMSMLEFLNLQYNTLIDSLQKLEALYLGSNSFIGIIPSTIYMGQSCPNLEEILLGSNKLSGQIPFDLSNCSKLITLDFTLNLFSGTIPKSLGNLKHLQRLFLSGNQLIGGEAKDHKELNFVSSLSNCRVLRSLYVNNNPLDITIPDSIQNFSASFQIFIVSNCQIKGHIPMEMGSLKGLIWLDLGVNNLTGSIPFTFRGLETLQRLHLDSNKLEGLILEEICELRNLGELHLSNNRIARFIPNCISNLSLLLELLLGLNRLGSSIPLDIWSLKNLLFLDLSLNSLGGHFSSNMTKLVTLEYMDLSRNQITGEIPCIIGAFESLRYLDLSNNSLQGGIPQSFGNLKGGIPSSGPFVNFMAKSFSRNKALCGNPIFGVPHCPMIPTYQQSKMKNIFLKRILPVIASITTFMMLIYLLRSLQKSNMQIPSSPNVLPKLEQRMISYQELCRGTNNFCERNLLGAGGFGYVYKGILSDRTIVAVKVLRLQLPDALQSFDAECKVLRTIQHRNLVKVITTCTNPEFRALVLEYMSKGNLERWLYSHNYCLDLLRRINIVVDVASALDYLHHGQSESILHCDLKPTNILLDEDMVTHVGNFGIAKILVKNKDATHTKTLGTIGYIAPLFLEFGFEGMVSIKSDVYSFGIVLLEMITRKKPTDGMFAGGFTLRQLVNASIPDRMMEVMDEGLLRIEDGRDTIALQSVLSSILDLGLRCSEELPDTRMDIKDVMNTVVTNMTIRIYNKNHPGY
ncbi:hypothetical protein I3842_01G039000 [Carya illinoinensis]|uniref:non-specific serine/threonine protein kinase n=1 Tax=Carya illinoinensis TaxID=32201 RepID=A0A922FWA3_CARIL|nr:hypothetical protein I3842_01G039000 [Carya illinoinensis]